MPSEALPVSQDPDFNASAARDLFLSDGTMHDMANATRHHDELKLVDGPEPQSIFELPRVEPTLFQVVDQMKIVTAQTAVQAIQDIEDAYGFIGPITSEAREQLEVDLDVNATPVMEAQIHMAPYRTRVRKVEGAKENRKYGRVLPGIKPVLGFGELLKIEDSERLADADNLGDVEVILDPIEGTKRASNNMMGATAMSGGSIKGRLPEIPGEEAAHYNNRRVVGRRVAELIRNEGIDISNISITKLARLTARAHSVHVSEVGFIYLERERNQAEIKALRKIGVTNIRLIQDGDLVPGLEVLTKDEPMVSAGSGGKEEAAILAYAAKVTDGEFGGHYVNDKGRRLKNHPEALTLDVMAPGDKEDYFVTFAAITDVPELGLSRVAKVPEAGEGAYNVTVATLTSEYPYLQTDIIPISKNLPKAA